MNARDSKIRYATTILASVFGKDIPFLLIVGTPKDDSGSGTTTMGNTSREDQLRILKAIVASFEANTDKPMQPFAVSITKPKERT